MNSNIIVNGPAETITNPAVAVTRVAQLIEAETDMVISAITYQFPAAPPNAQAVSAFTLKAGRHLFNVSSIAFTGTGTFTYRV